MEGIKRIPRPPTAGRRLKTRRVRALCALTALISAAGAFGVVPRGVAAQASPGITFAVSQIPATLVNGRWQMETGVGVGGLNWITLSHGTVPGGGLLTIPIDLTTALQTVNNHFMVVMYQRIDDNDAYLGNALLGVVKTDLIDGATFNVVPVVNQVPVYHSDAAAVAASSCSSCLAPDNPGYVWAPGNTGSSVATQAPARAAASAPTLSTTNNIYTYTSMPNEAHQLEGAGDPVPVLCFGPSAGACWGPASPILGPLTNGPGTGIPNAPSSCPLTSGCVSAAGSTAQGVGTCNRNTSLDQQSNDCVLAANDFSAETFRGWSNKVPGDSDTYVVHNGYEQTWDNGYRTQKGPFTNDNSTSQTYSGGSDITYQKRGDCWSPSAPGDDPSSLCTGTGWDSNWGQDAWRWEKHSVQTCYTGGGCNDQTTYEIVFDNTFNGGNDVSYQNDLTGESVRPGLITNDAYGPDWARWNPDSSRETKLGTAAQISHGVTMDIAFSQSYGGYTASGDQTYTSSETDTKYADQGNQFTFRGPASGLPWFGYWYNYDGNHRTWAWEYWTCQFNSGYVGAMNESELYTGNTQCWDASQ